MLKLDRGRTSQLSFLQKREFEKAESNSIGRARQESSQIVSTEGGLAS